MGVKRAMSSMVPLSGMKTLPKKAKNTMPPLAMPRAVSDLKAIPTPIP